MGNRVRLSHYGDRRGLALENNKWGQQSSGAFGQQSVKYHDQAIRARMALELERCAPAQRDRLSGSDVRLQAVVAPTHVVPPASAQRVAHRLRFSTPASADWNAAFEVWLASSPIAHEANVTAEVMIWVARAGSMNRAGGSYPSQTWPQCGFSIYEGHTGQWPI